MMVESARSLAALAPDEVKLHLLHVIDGTRLAEMYRLGEYSPLSLEEYVSILVSQLELFSPSTVIARVTGDGDRNTLLAPLWSLKKFCVMNEIDKRMRALDTWQGKRQEKYV